MAQHCWAFLLLAAQAGAAALVRAAMSSELAALKITRTPRAWYVRIGTAIRATWYGSETRESSDRELSRNRSPRGPLAQAEGK
jgi:hypothetical protein